MRNSTSNLKPNTLNLKCLAFEMLGLGFEVVVL